MNIFRYVISGCILVIFFVCSGTISLENSRETYPYALPSLPYSYNTLEPYIDAFTMDIHYNKHHQGYVNKLNAALKKYPKLQRKGLVELVTHLDAIPKAIRTSIRNNGGGHFAHSLYWQVMSPDGGGAPAGELAEVIDENFGDFDMFKKKFEAKAASFFGSGWTWLCVNPEGTLRIISTSGHDVPMNQSLWPILVIDIWEHAYYLKYQNNRDNYIKRWWNVVNWKQVERLYKKYKNVKID